MTSMRKAASARLTCATTGWTSSSAFSARSPLVLVHVCPNCSRYRRKAEPPNQLVSTLAAEVDCSMGAPTEAINRPSHAGSRMVHAVAWTGAATWVAQLASWGYMAIVARILTPADYGLIGMANVPLGLLMIASEFGVGNAVIMLPDLTHRQISQMNTVAVACGFTLFVASCFAAYVLGMFFRAPELPLVIMGLSLTLIITSFKTVPDALLQREFRYSLLAKIQAAQAITFGVTAVASALSGAAYWSLVIANLAGATIATLLVL